MAPQFPSHPLLRRAIGPVIALITITVVGVTGFIVLAGIGVVEAVFWLVDPTSTAIHFTEHGGPEQATKAFAIVIRVGLILATLWIGESVLSAAFSGQITEELRYMQTERTVEDLSGHTIVCGYGIFGRTVASRLEEAGHDVVAIELDPAEYEQIEQGTLAIQGDARREDVLARANIEQARAVVAAIDDSNANIQIAITASQLAPDVHIIVRVGDELYETLARRAGADEVVIPEVLSGITVSDWL